MKAFAALYDELDSATSTQHKQAALVRYFSSADAEDAAWAAWFLSGAKPRQVVPTKIIRAAALEISGLPEWLFAECYDAVGDFAETVALVLPDSAGRHSRLGGNDAVVGELSAPHPSLAWWLTQRVLPLRGQSPAAQQAGLLAAWRELEAGSRFVFNKLITGELRVGVSRLSVTRALATVSGVDAKCIAQRLIGYLASHALPDAESYRDLLAQDDAGLAGGEPYPFFLAQQLNGDPAQTLGDAGDWQAEWKWDGMRGQLVRRGEAQQIWSRGDELITERFPELLELAVALPHDAVLDGEILVWGASGPRPFADLQTRMTRKRITPKLVAETPVAFMAYDLLEEHGQDLRPLPMRQRRARLEAFVHQAAHPLLKLSTVLHETSWDALAAVRATARERGAEGLMLKRLDSAYGVGRTKGETRGEWWKWKLDPMSVDAVLVYAQRGHGRRASLYTDYTFAVWQENEAGERELLPFAKAYSGLTDAEIKEVDAFIHRNTLEKFGPVRTVAPKLVMEIGFEGVAESKRHKSGIAVRFPRILRIRHDKPVEEADTVGSLRALLRVYGGA